LSTNLQLSMQARASTPATGAGSATGIADVKKAKQAMVKIMRALEYILHIVIDLGT